MVSDELEPRRPPVWRAAAYGVGALLLLGGYFWIRDTKDEMRRAELPLKRTVDPIRLDLKLALDSAAPKPDQPAVQSTIGAFLDLERPTDLSGDDWESHDRRCPPLETTIWTLKARITDVVLREDNDFYLVIEDGGRTTCAEVPNPELCKESPFYEDLKMVRSQIERDFKPSRTPRKLNLKAELTGIGFFGKPSTGLRKNNGARLYPLLKLKLLTSP